MRHFVLSCCALMLILPGGLRADIVTQRLPQVEYLQHLNAQLPLDAHFKDEHGTDVRLGKYFNDEPVVMVLGYYRCRTLCSMLMAGVLQAIGTLRVADDRYRIVAVSIDPTETPAIAAAKQREYQVALPKGELHLLTGQADNIAKLAKTAGFNYVYDRSSQQYMHPAGFFIVTPHGSISRYFLGVRFNAEDVRGAIDAAADNRVGGVVTQLLLLCAHFDPHTGRYTMTAMNAIRVVCVTIVIALLGFVVLRHGWRSRS